MHVHTMTASILMQWYVHASVRKPMQIPQWIEIRVNHHQKIAVKTGTDLQLQLQLRYFVPLEYAHTVASDTVSKDLNILAKLPLGLAKSLGSTHTIFRASLASEHSLSIASDTTLSNKPDSKIQQRCHLQ